MLQSLTIKNVALIKNLNLDFTKGFNVLLGETGAGKSIIFDALNFVLGEKVNKELLRNGESYMKVDALFTNLSKVELEFLAEMGIECEENEVLLSRQYNADGKSTIRINTVPALGATLKKVGQYLVDSYSQHESMELLSNKNHLLLLDKFGGQSLHQLKEEVKERYNRYKTTIKQIEDLGGDAFERERTKSLLEYQVKEIEEANLHIGEDEEINAKLTIMTNAEKIAEATDGGSDILENGSGSVLSGVQSVLLLLNSVHGVAEIEELQNRLNSCKYELQDISETLRTIKESLQFDQYELERLDKRKDMIKSLMRKYGSTIEEVLKFYQSAAERLKMLENAEEQLSRLEKLREEQYKALSQACDSLTNKRKEVAKVIEARVVDELAQLNMKNTTFVIEFNKLQNFLATGNDEVAFTFSANKGQQVKALSKTASGGEMSRFMLAIKNIFAEYGNAQTLIFDEIDAGISGETGVVVGEKIAKISRANQVICITHLPQVACYGDNFFYVSKEVQGQSTQTKVKTLEEEGVIYELARMIGGNNVTEVALGNAKELRKRRESKKP